MSKKTLVVITTLIVLVIAGAVGVYALTKGAPRSTTPPAGTDAGIEMVDPVTADPVLAAQAAVSGLFSWDPSTQDSPQAAAAAISDRLTGKLHTYATSGTADAVLPKLWSTWAESGDKVNAVGIPDEHATVPEGSDSAVVELTLRQQVMHPDGELTPYHEGQVAVTVEKVDGLWKAAAYEYLSVKY